MMILTIRLTDTAFLDSPDVGDEECLCSRCGTRISDVAIRAWSAHEAGEAEYRFHPECLGIDSTGPADYDDGPVEEL